MSVDSSAPRSRRAILTAALGGLGAVVVSRFASPEAAKAADGDAVNVGDSLTGTTVTKITTAAAATAIEGHSADGVGLWGANDSVTPIDPVALSNRQTGIIGHAGNGTGVAGNTGETGVYGFADVSGNSVGVWGDSPAGIGVLATSGAWGLYAQGHIGVMGDVGPDDTGIYGFARNSVPPNPPSGAGVIGEADSTATGVYGFVGATGVAAPAPTAGVGVQAAAGSTSQVALKVAGKAPFSRSARTSFTAGHSSKKITMTGVTTASYIIATLQSKRTGIYVQSVVPAAGSFTIYLNKAVTSTTYVGYLVIN
jgi:hypothetical protein